MFKAWVQNLVNGLLIFAANSTVQRTKAEYAAEHLKALKSAGETASECMDFVDDLFKNEPTQIDGARAEIAALLRQGTLEAITSLNSQPLVKVAEGQGSLNGNPFSSSLPNGMQSLEEGSKGQEQKAIEDNSNNTEVETKGEATEPQAEEERRGPGRPRGSKNKPKVAIEEL